MKKRVLFLVMSLCILMIAVGCNKADDTSTAKPTKAAAVTVAPTAAATKDATTAEETVAPVKEAYVTSDYITLGEYKGIKVTVEQLEVTDDDVDAAIQEALTAAATTEAITDRAVKDGDIVNIDYEGLLDGAAFDGGTDTGFDLTIGSGTFVEGFESGIIGAKIGDKLTLDVTFPDDYGVDTLNGKAVVFNVTVNSISVSVTPKLTENYVKKNTDYDSIKAYKAGTRKDLEAANVKTMKTNKANSVLSGIVDNSKISSFPDTLITYYTYEMTNYYSQYAAMYGMEFADFLSASGMTQDDFDKEAKSYAESMATQELVINSIIDAEKITLTDDEYTKGVANFVTEYGYESEEALLKSATEEQLRETLIWQKALDYVVSVSVEK